MGPLVIWSLFQIHTNSNYIQLIGILSISGPSATVWVVGSSIPYWAKQHSLSRPGGKNLGLTAQISWKARRGMEWSHFDSFIEREIGKETAPNYILVQLGSNDLVNVKSKELIESINCSFLRLSLLAPNTTIIWSDILPRAYWHGAKSQKNIDMARKRVNSVVRSRVLQSNGRAIKHPNITFSDFTLFRFDGAHLTDLGNSIYLNNIQGALEIFLSGGGHLFPPA